MSRDSTFGEVFQRLGQRFRNIAQLSIQVEEQEWTQERAIRDLPDDLDHITNDLDRLTEQLRLWREIVSIHQSNSKESREALSTLADTARNAASIFGPDGQNIEILLKTDWQFIKFAYVEPDDAIKKTALQSMTDDEFDSHLAMLEAERERRKND